MPNNKDKLPQQLESNLTRFPRHSVLLPLLSHTHNRGARLSRTQLQEPSGERIPQIEVRLPIGPSFSVGVILLVSAQSEFNHR